jgi:diguanylate cyclase (GGDEF)-like protein
LRRFRIGLSVLIVSLSALTALGMLAGSFYASYDVQRRLLIENALDSNHAYATKLAVSTEAYLRSALQQLNFSARLQGRSFDDQQILQDEAERLLRQTTSFNSVAVVDRAGVVRATAPFSLSIQGKRLDSVGAHEALRNRAATVSSPYLSAAGNLVVFISQPITSSNGSYLGYVGGTLHLKHDNTLRQLLTEQHGQEGSYLYVVDRNKRLVYHPEPERVGTLVAKNALADNLASVSDGAQRVINSQGVEMLAGFATVPTAGWGIVSQRPVDETLVPLDDLMLSVVMKTLPFAIISFALIWWIARRISLPLTLMARDAPEIGRSETAERIKVINAWYFEAEELKRALLVGLEQMHDRLGELNHEAQTDPLTGLNNRRCMELALKRWKAERKQFSVIAIDIDHFKSVNDTYGHDLGDIVLKRVAELIVQYSRESDVPCRTGGEEFSILLPGTGIETAHTVAERLRLAVESTMFPGVGRLTISLGVAQSSSNFSSPIQTLKTADELLYEAKSSGRNRVSSCSDL